MTGNILSLTGNRSLDLCTPKIMGILNVTSDSFSDGGLYTTVDAALKQAQAMVKAGAAVIDVGGESTRPGAQTVSVDEECARVVPVVKAIAENLDTVISVDTSSPEVMRECAALGAHMWNDIRALQRPDALQTAAQLGVAVCLMHMQGNPQTMQDKPHYEDVLTEVSNFLLQRTKICLDAGIQQDKIMLDPGFGFGKSVTDNYTLLKHLDEICKLGYPVLSALSRKSMIGYATHQDIPAERVLGSVSGAVISIMKGVAMVRVHDVAQTAQAFAVFNAMQDAL